MGMNMKAAVFHGAGRIEMHADVVRPKPAPGEVLVRVAACGICGSDLHIYREQSAVTEALYYGTLRIDADGKRIIGHEYSGVIAELGADVTEFRVGERVVGVTAGGGMAEYVSVPASPFQLARVPDTVSLDEAATTEPLADGLQMVRKAAAQPGENVVVFGAGIIGLGVIQALRAKVPEHGRIVAVDVSAPRLAMALELGATDAIDASREDVVAAAGRICGTLEWPFPQMCPPNVAVVIDCAGYIKGISGPPPLQTALELLRPRDGRIVCFGTFEDRVLLDLAHLIDKEPTIHGSMGYLPQELDQALELMASGKLDRRKLISHRFALDEVHEAFEVQAGGKAIKVMVMVNEELQ
ncbi:MAG: zinc-binding dehydrogenase [Pseudomonadales bacterium]|jgi:threonine dehydrogenase-like Zn-dependent dehydrogenase|nr:zinc-binding dehydrogenase [Pseudomonadales bacterium]